MKSEIVGRRHTTNNARENPVPDISYAMQHLIPESSQCKRTAPEALRGYECAIHAKEVLNVAKVIRLHTETNKTNSSCAINLSRVAMILDILLHLDDAHIVSERREVVVASVSCSVRGDRRV
jgi:hypothetical protein